MILVLNVGSTSLKFGLYDRDEREINRGYFDIDTNVTKTLKQVFREIGNLDLVEAIGHRVVHGGEKFTKPVAVSSNVIEDLQKLNDLAPLHNPYNIEGIQAMREWFPNIPNIAVFDTAFFADLPERAKTYAIPYHYLEQGIRRYGFHGISHKYIAQEASKLLKKPLSTLNLIICHLGGGASVSAIKSGRPIDTSMGFTPMEGLVMMTRSGDIDPGIIFYLQKQGIDVEHLLMHESGIRGFINTDDYQDLLARYHQKQKKAMIAMEIWIYRLQKYIASYAGILGKVHSVVLTGSIGSGDPITKELICREFPLLKTIPVLIIKTNEEQAIAREMVPFLD